MRLEQYRAIMQAIAISIHALAWSATHYNCGSTYVPDISIHALAWSATGRSGSRYRLVWNFNSRTRVECDHLGSSWLYHYYLFQFTHSRGVRRREQDTMQVCEKFQFTHSRGVRPRWAIISTNWKIFQFTHSRGVRLEKEKDYAQLSEISIHALAWSATSIKRG